MKNNNSQQLKNQQGFSVVEILLCLVIASSILISSAYMFSSVFNKIAAEDFHRKINNYANYALSDINSSFVIANKIDIAGYSDKNTITLETSAGKVKYSINDDIGILKALGGGGDELIAHKTSNQLFSVQQENKLYSFDIVKFTCEKINTEDGETYGGAIGDNEQGFKRSFYKLNLAFKLYFNDEEIDVIEFERKIFSPKAYINNSV